MSDVETIEVPVTRCARVTLVGRITEIGCGGCGGQFHFDSIEDEWLLTGDRIALRPSSAHGSPWRPGTGAVTAARRSSRWIEADLSSIIAACVGDFVYRVEPA